MTSYVVYEDVPNGDWLLLRVEDYLAVRVGAFEDRVAAEEYAKWSQVEEEETDALVGRFGRLVERLAGEDEEDFSEDDDEEPDDGVGEDYDTGYIVALRDVVSVSRQYGHDVTKLEEVCAELERMLEEENRGDNSPDDCCPVESDDGIEDTPSYTPDQREEMAKQRLDLVAREAKLLDDLESLRYEKALLPRKKEPF